MATQSIIRSIFVKTTQRGKQARLFGNKPLTADGALEGCCTFQTSNPNNPNYIAPCCLNEWAQSKPVNSINGSMLGTPRIFGRTYARPK